MVPWMVANIFFFSFLSFFLYHTRSLLAWAVQTVLLTTRFAALIPRILLSCAVGSPDVRFPYLSLLHWLRLVISSLLLCRLFCSPPDVQPICSPTRSALMTGRYTIRLGTQSNVIYWDTPWGVPLNETYIPQNLKDVGYKTAMFGCVMRSPFPYARSRKVLAF